MTEADVLRRAKALIADEAKFCQMSFARDRDGNHADPLSSNACQWCAAGAILRVTEAAEGFFNGASTRAFEALARAIGYDATWTDVERMISTIAGENDRAGKKDRRPDLAHARMLNLFDAAIKDVEARTAA